ncbi:hypothetical protein NKI94_24545 [Mesorhizobium australicum]|uniref:hypothetical protein n=1 Tax=Mesorhizobium australicum TaxID=536018 RepID=UPI00333BBBEB
MRRAILPLFATISVSYSTIAFADVDCLRDFTGIDPISHEAIRSAHEKIGELLAAHMFSQASLSDDEIEVCANLETQANLLKQLIAIEDECAPAIAVGRRDMLKRVLKKMSKHCHNDLDE